MSTFEQGATNAKQVAGSVDKDNPTKEEIAAADAAATDQKSVPPSTQSDTAVAEDAKDLIVADGTVGPEPDGTVRNDQGKVAYAPPGSYNAAMAGVQQDAAGHVDSVGTDNSSKSGTRI